MIECHPGDRASALRARAERALRCVPGTLAQTLAQQSRVLVIDDIQHLRTDEATSLLAPLLLGPTALGRIVVVGRDPLSAAVGASIAELELQGLDVESAGALWASLEETFGAAPKASTPRSRRTRGVPLALRREYARARFGAQRVGHRRRSTRRRAPRSKRSPCCARRSRRPRSPRSRPASTSKPR